MTKNICSPVCTDSDLTAIRLIIRSIVLLIGRLAPAIAIRKEDVCTIRPSSALSRVDKCPAIFQSYATAITSGRCFLRILQNTGRFIVNTEMHTIRTWSRIRQNHHILIRDNRSTERTHTRFCANRSKPLLCAAVRTTFNGINTGRLSCIRFGRIISDSYINRSVGIHRRSRMLIVRTSIRFIVLSAIKSPGPFTEFRETNQVIITGRNINILTICTCCRRSAVHHSLLIVGMRP